MHKKKKAFFSMITFLIALSAPIGLVHAKGLENVDDYIQAIREKASAGEFKEVAKALDPEGFYGEQLYQPAETFLSSNNTGEPFSTDILIRDKSSEMGERVLFTIWSGRAYLYFAVIFHRRPDGWLPINISYNTDIEELMHYF